MASGRWEGFVVGRSWKGELAGLWIGRRVHEWVQGCRLGESWFDVRGLAEAWGRECRASACTGHELSSWGEPGRRIFGFLAVSALCRSALDMRTAINEAVHRMSAKSIFESAKPSGCPMVAEISITPCEAVQAAGDGCWNWWSHSVRACEKWFGTGVPAHFGRVISADGCIGGGCLLDIVGWGVCGIGRV